MGTLFCQKLPLKVSMGFAAHPSKPNLRTHPWHQMCMIGQVNLWVLESNLILQGILGKPDKVHLMVKNLSCYNIFKSMFIIVQKDKSSHELIIRPKYSIYTGRSLCSQLRSHCRCSWCREAMRWFVDGHLTPVTVVQEILSTEHR